MKTLISLELRRTPLRPYLLGALWVFLGMAAMAGLLASLPAMTAAMGDSLEPEDALLFSRWELLLPVLGGLNMAAFSIFAGVLASRFLVSEYSGRRAILLLSYPTPRKRVLAAKCLLVFFLPALAGAASLLLVTAGLALCSGLLGLMAQPFGPAQLGYALGLAGLLGVISGGVGLLSAPFGFTKGSVAAVIVAAVVIACLLAQVLSALSSLGLLAGGTAVVLLAALSAAAALGRRVERMELL